MPAGDEDIDILGNLTCITVAHSILKEIRVLWNPHYNAEWDNERIRKWAYTIAKNTGEVIDRIFGSVKIKEQGYNASLSVLRFAKIYTENCLEVACESALARIRTPRYSHLKALLSSSQDILHFAKKSELETKELNDSVQGYVRGSDYYGGGDKL